MRGIEVRLSPETAHNLAKSRGPPPLAVMTMLGSAPRPRQAAAGRDIYDFSLNLDSSILSGP